MSSFQYTNSITYPYTCIVIVAASTSPYEILAISGFDNTIINVTSANRVYGSSSGANSNYRIITIGY